MTNTMRLSYRFNIAGVIMLTHAIMLGWESWQNSPAHNEVAHLPAGLAIWKCGRFDLYRVNPPLVKMIASLPSLLGGAKTDWSDHFSGIGGRPEWVIGRAFIRANRHDWYWYYILARWTVIPLTLLGGYICYRWSSELYGHRSGLLALILWCSSPDILAWAATITPDASAAAIGAAACYCFRRWLVTPNWSWVLAAGASLGLAELSKMTWIVLFVLWPILWLLWTFVGRAEVRTPGRGRQLCQLVTILLLGLDVLNLGYGFQGSLLPLKDYTFASRAFAGSDSPLDGGVGGNRFSGYTWSAFLVPVAKDYVIGLDIQLYDFEQKKWSYLDGEWKYGGWWYYYLYGLVLKVPLGTWLLAVSALTRGTLSRTRCSPGWREELTLLSPAFVILLLVSSETGFSRHLRYVLPIYPFLFIWVSKAASRLGGTHRAARLVVILGLAWSITSSLCVYPHSMSYFNELAGGPVGGHAHFIDSNIDWGQDLFYLKKWVDSHEDARPMHVWYFGEIDPKDAGVDFQPMPRSAADGRPILVPGWHAVSVNYLRGYRYKGPDDPYPDNPYCARLLGSRPVAMAGYSIHIYYVSEAELDSKKQ